MNKPIIFLDVDGTLVSFNTHKVPESSIVALKEAHKNGAKIVIATGRPITDLKEICEVPYDAVIALNGADIALRDGKRIFTRPIPYDEFEKAMGLAEKYGFIIGIENDGGVAVNRHGDILVEWAGLVAHRVSPVADLYKEFAENICCQLCFFCDETTQIEVMKDLPLLNASRWNPLFADINIKGVDKSTGIDEVCRYYGCHKSDTIAFGDGGNDIPMIKSASIGIAMGNASDEVKSVADFVTDSVDDDGICNALVRMKIIDTPSDMPTYLLSMN